MARGIESIERGAQAQAQLIEDLLDISRVATGKVRLDIERVDVVSVLHSAIDSLQLAADAKGIQLAVTLGPSARYVEGDASRLQQVFCNLLSNAIKFTPANRQVAVQLERAGTEVEIRVSDTGEGISEDFLPFIFDDFRQADGTVTRRHGGLGLGLAIVRHMVELHGGTVQAHSPGRGQGATFTVRLPLADLRAGRRQAAGALPQAAPPTDEPPLPSLEGVQVLLVDDEREILQLLTPDANGAPRHGSGGALGQRGAPAAGVVHP